MNKGLIIISALLLTLFLGALWWLERSVGGTVTGTVSPAEQLAADPENYKRADDPRDFEFPEDHGPHPGYRTEWWYYTGNLTSKDGRKFGYQFTIFRNQLSPPDTIDEERKSAWATDQLYMGHFAVSDLDEEVHYSEERQARGAQEMAGAESPPFRVWLEGWTAHYEAENKNDRKSPKIEGAGKGSTPMRLQAQMEEAGIDLLLDPVKPIVKQGNEGYDQKGPEKGDASYYLSFTRMETEGTINMHGKEFEVEGLSWMDHEWSTSALTGDQVGWDWFSVQLSDGYDLMLYQIREEGGRASPYMTGTLVNPEGEVQRFDKGDAEITARDHWVSPKSGGEYPVKWGVEIPEAELSLDLEVYFEDQEMDASVLYYEGAIKASGTHKNNDIGGRGYVEMTGYGDEAAGEPGF